MQYYKRLQLLNGSISCEIVYKKDDMFLNSIIKSFPFVFYRSDRKTYIKAKKWLDYNYRLICEFEEDGTKKDINRPKSNYII